MKKTKSDNGYPSVPIGARHWRAHTCTRGCRCRPNCGGVPAMTESVAAYACYWRFSNAWISSDVFYISPVICYLSHLASTLDCKRLCSPIHRVPLCCYRIILICRSNSGAAGSDCGRWGPSMHGGEEHELLACPSTKWFLHYHSIV